MRWVISLVALAACSPSTLPSGPDNWKRFDSKSLPVDARAIVFPTGRVDASTAIELDGVTLAWSRTSPYVDRPTGGGNHVAVDTALVEVQNLRCDRGSGMVPCELVLVQRRANDTWICDLNFTKSEHADTRADVVHVDCPTEIMLDR
jgi:hypothetical protein